MATVLFTGFPGFLGSEMLPRVLARAPERRALCLVQAKFAPLARDRVAALVARDPSLSGRIELIEGDITLPGLGLADEAGVAADVVEIWHLAAVYDLAVARDLAMRVNVDGTRHILAFAKACPNLARLQYVSTCYVSGTYPGAFREADLEMGQQFANYYEETKYLAEVDVRTAMRDGLPATIYRPAIVVGDSHTGETQKYDGPYFAMQLVLRQPKLAVLPIVGDPHAAVINVVPRNFVLSAIEYLSGQESTVGQTFQLADPNPLTVWGMLKAIGGATGRRIITVQLPLALAKWSIHRVPGLFGLLRVPAEVLDYFVLQTRYDTTATQAALAGSGISCPSFADYCATLVRFMEAHPEIGSAAMV